MVADGVGGGVHGAEASSLAVRTATEYVTHALRCYHESGQDPKTLELQLGAAALAAHDAVRAERLARAEIRTMATTLTMALAIWPTAYILQVGDSRCYFFQEGQFRRLTRDQTVAQALLDQGVFTKESAAVSPLGNVLASAIGSEEAHPEITRVDITARSLFLLCSDGLTKHVKDDEIEHAIRTMTSSEAIARSLLALALERGGSDNVTILVVRAKGVR
jgi:serine/threonine protein phosphatase PrpC